MRGTHKLDADERALGRRHSQALRTAKKRAFLSQVSDHLIDLARAGKLEEKLRLCADQLNARGVRTVKGLPLDPQKLSLALKQLGCDKNSLDLLVIKTKDAADDFGVGLAEMFEQLWHEWLYHQTITLVETGQVVDIPHQQRFEFKPIRPFDWNKRRPELRDPRAKAWWYGENRVVPPQARLVASLLTWYIMSNQIKIERF